MILYTVVPCYNEEEMLPKTAAAFRAKYDELIAAGKISEESKVLFVDDGSKDRTWEMICSYHESDGVFCGVKLSRNRGHQNALFAGLMTAVKYADAMISIDADLQDDIGVFGDMLDKFAEGCDIVYGVRSKRETDSFMKRFTAEGYYKVMEFFGTGIIFNHADYRLMSRRAVEALSEFGEVNLFLRGMVPQIGYKTAEVYYERTERTAGESKYTLKKMLELAWNGITSFSVKPIEMILGGGVLMSTVSIFALFVMLILSIAGKSVGGTGWIIASIFLCCGINLAALGVIGQYVGRAYLETKHRPKYIIEDVRI